jgi:hypothetical protein
LSHLFTILLGVERGFSEQNRVFLGCDSEFVVECVVPDLLHVVPVGNDTVLNGVFEGKDTTLGLGFISDISYVLILGRRTHPT